MKKLIKLSFLIFIIYSCQSEKEHHWKRQTNWDNREALIAESDSLYHGKTYLPVYSHIYQIHEHRTFDLTITASIRNISLTDSVYLLSADYYNTEGEKLRHYFKHPIYLAPLETIEIIIHEGDREGGSGANFIFDWAAENRTNPPLFEAVMISTYGKNGISFSTRGVEVFD